MGIRINMPRKIFKLKKSHVKDYCQSLISLEDECYHEHIELYRSSGGDFSFSETCQVIA
jgi:hypothetical protein